MEFQRDYVLRIIEMMGDFFRRIGDILDEKDRLREMDALCREHCGIPLDTARQLSIASLTELLTPQTRFVLSELLYVRAHSLFHKEEEAAGDLLQSAHVLLSLNAEPAVCSERADRLRELLSESEAALSSDDYLSAARFFVSAERFADCEDMVFLAAETAGDRNYAVLQGLSILQNIRILPAEVLTAGGLPPTEVDRAISDLMAIN